MAPARVFMGMGPLLRGLYTGPSSGCMALCYRSLLALFLGASTQGPLLEVLVGPLLRGLYSGPSSGCMALCYRSLWALSWGILSGSPTQGPFTQERFSYSGALYSGSSLRASAHGFLLRNLPIRPFTARTSI